MEAVNLHFLLPMGRVASGFESTVMQFSRKNFRTQALRHHAPTAVENHEKADLSRAQPASAEPRLSGKTAPTNQAALQDREPLERQSLDKAGSGQSRIAEPGARSLLRQVEDKFRDQPWQSYFYLAPNVRFTRTPERRPAAETDQEATAASRESATFTGRIASSTARERTPAKPVEVPPSAYAFGSLLGQGLELSALAMKPRAKGYASVSVEQGGSWREGGVSPQPEDRNASKRSCSAARAACWRDLSDHAFFELMPFDESEDWVPASFRQVAVKTQAQRSAVPAAARQVRLPVAGASEITSLFRVIECSPPPASDAVNAPLPEPKAEVRYETSTAATEERIMAADAASRENAARERDRQAAGRVVPFPPAPMKRASAPVVVAPRHSLAAGGSYEFPSEELLQNPPEGQGFYMTQEQIEQNAGLLENVLEDFGVRGEIIHVRPGPVVTLYEFEPAPGVKSSRVINLADDIARSMSAVSARVAVVPGRNVIGIELPNVERETVYLRELIQSGDFHKTGYKLALCLGKTIGGEAVIAELAKMPHLLVAGTTGSGKSVAINTMILSLLYRLRPEECRLIMVDPKMLELSVYDGIPHLLTPVVTDPKKAVTALKWAVREMEDRYRKMARLGVRNIDGYNQRAATARDKGEPVLISVQTGFDRSTGEPIYEEQEMDLAPMPYIVVIVDEMADLMMVAGKEIEGAIQRLAQMARAAGIHLIMATQRPSVDVITGTIKANFPTRISFQVTSKIDSRTILGEQGAEQLLGQGDMLHMSGGGRIVRVHGPFVSDEEVEQVVAHLKTQGRPEYLDTVTADEEEEQAPEEDSAVFDKGAIASEDGNEIYDQAVKVVLRDKRCSTSYIQRRLGIGYNRAASLIERMEKEGLVGKPNHVGKREILMGGRDVGPSSGDGD